MLEGAGRTPETERSSRKEPLSEADAQAILSESKRVIVCRGRKTVESAAHETNLDDLKGPTGNYRAPILLLDDTLLVGFNQQKLADLLA